MRAPARRILTTLIVGIAAATGVVCGSPTDNKQANNSGAATLLWADRAALIPAPPATDGTRAYWMTLQRTALAVDVATGSPVWNASTSVGDTSTLFGNPLTITLGRMGCTVATDVVLCNDNGIVALRPSDGTLLWRTPGILSICPIRCPALATHDSSAFWTTGPIDSVVSVNVHTGARRWAVGGMSSITSLSVDSGIVAIAGIGASTAIASVVGVSEATGAVLWRTQLGTASTASSTALWQGLVLASATDGNLYALDRTTGAVLWTVAGLDTGIRDFVGDEVFVPCFQGPMDQPILVIGNNLFVVTTSGATMLIDLQAHAVLHRSAPQLGTHYGQPLVADASNVYVVNHGGVIGVYSTADTHLVNAYTLPPDQLCGVAVAGKSVLATGTIGIYGISP